MHRVHDVGAAGNRGQWHSAGNALGHRDEVGRDTLLLAREPRSGTGESGLHLVGDEQHAVHRAPLGQRREESGCGNDESTFALDRFDDDRGGGLSTDLLLDHRDRTLGRSHTVAAEFVAVRIAHRHPVHLGRERTEVALVRHALGRHRHRQVGAPVVGVIERDDRVASRRQPGDLDRVLDGLGARIEQHGALLEVAGGDLVELLGDGHVALVRRHHEAGVREVRRLLGDCRRDGGVARADGGDGDAGAEVDQRVAVDVDDHSAVGVGRENGNAGADARGDGTQSALPDLHRAWAGQFADQLPLLGQPVDDVGCCGHGHQCSPAGPTCGPDKLYSDLTLHCHNVQSAVTVGE